MAQEIKTNYFRDSPDGPVQAAEMMRQTTQGKLVKSDKASDVVVMNPEVSRLGFEMSDNMKLAVEVACDIAKIVAPIAGVAALGAFAWSNPIGTFKVLFTAGAIHGIYDLMVNGGLTRVNYIDSRSKMQVLKDKLDMADFNMKCAIHNLLKAKENSPEEVLLPLIDALKNAKYNCEVAETQYNQALAKKTH